MTVPTTASNFEERWVIVCVNPSNPDDKMEFPSFSEMNAKLFQLKAEVEAQAKRWAESEDLILHYKQQRDEAYNDCECHRLKAELERLKNTDPNSISGSTIMSDPAWSIACFRFHRENERAEIARLRKAGDELERVLISRSGSYEAGNASHEWQSAKKYKPSV